MLSPKNILTLYKFTLNRGEKVIQEWLISLIGSIATIVISISSLAHWLGKKFGEIDARFREIDKRFESYDKKFEEIDKRFISIDKRFEALEKRLDSIENEIRSLRITVSRIVEVVKSSQEFMIDFLSYEGVLRKEASDVIRHEISRIFRVVSMYTNPLTKEEVERLKQLIEKEELTLEEAEELYEIANKLVYEYGTSETWKLLFYARFWIGYNLRKMKEQREREKQKEKQC
ncbi:conserved hypothetical protein [Ignisphaera aggregans DSM 17230]|uniref:Uncharacterized protein n=1 Tax=Ignisphaera aggregans (strain DSM 17230 / JCM 13409 / AQ1.S1) TaxID=583356 RepID=E0STT0_IGNAA|nr:conserved hypothetical protein [Ignisphaera aggregans DSM 17230]